MAQWTEPPPVFEPASFRDSEGRVFLWRDGVYRALSESMLDDWQTVHTCRFFQRRQADGSVVSTRLLSESDRVPVPGEDWSGILEHERLPVITYPYEWCFGMWLDAARLQLDLLAEALAEDVILKDATPFNVQFRGSTPVFIDTGSFTRYRSGTPWAAYRQFCCLFLYPLLLQAYRQIDIQRWLRSHVAGISPMECRQFFRWSDARRRGLLSHVFLHALMDRHIHAESRQLSAELRQQGFQKSLIEQNVRGLRKVLKNLTWKLPQSRWNRYEQQTAAETDQIHAKERFVETVARSRHWTTVWDLGCNTGRYSRLIGSSADLILAIDGDHASVEAMYRELRRQPQHRIVPLCMNLADPTPALGWRGKERSRLEHRSQPQLILCLALLHHLVLAENLPLDDVIAWLRERHADVVIEFVDRDDPQVQMLLAQRSTPGHHYSRDDFETAVRSRFEVRHCDALPGGTRTLYWLQPQ